MILTNLKSVVKIKSEVGIAPYRYETTKINQNLIFYGDEHGQCQEKTVRFGM